MKTRLLLVSLAVGAVAASLSACESTGGGGGSTGVDVSNQAYGLSVRLADTIGRCWFAPGQSLFPGYVYSPERNANVSRILIVKKDDPTGLPAMVVEPTSGTSATVYGPLAQSANSARIQSDVARWVKGSTSCT